MLLSSDRSLGYLTLYMQQKASLRRTGSSADEPHHRLVAGDIDHVFAERSAVAEVTGPPTRLQMPTASFDVQSVVAVTRAANVQLEVDDRETQVATAFRCEAPPTVGEHVISVWIARTGDVATAAAQHCQHFVRRASTYAVNSVYCTHHRCAGNSITQAISVSIS